MIRLVMRIDDAAMAANVGGSPQTTYRTFDIDLPDVEALLRHQEKRPNSLLHHTLVGAEVLPAPSAKDGGSTP